MYCLGSAAARATLRVRMVGAVVPHMDDQEAFRGEIEGRAVGGPRIERGVPCVGFPHSCNERPLSGDESHTGEVVLCWGLIEQA